MLGFFTLANEAEGGEGCVLSRDHFLLKPADNRFSKKKTFSCSSCQMIFRRYLHAYYLCHFIHLLIVAFVLNLMLNLSINFVYI